LALQPDFPEVLNNLGLLYGRAGDMERAERYFRDALGRLLRQWKGPVADVISPGIRASSW